MIICEARLFPVKSSIVKSVGVIDLGKQAEGTDTQRKYRSQTE